MAWLVMALTMVVDLDHLFANPVYDPNRCSIGFQPLHSYIAISAYALMAAVPKLRIAAVGLLIHMAVGFGDCILRKDVYFGIIKAGENESGSV